MSTFIYREACKFEASRYRSVLFLGLLPIPTSMLMPVQWLSLLDHSHYPMDKPNLGGENLFHKDKIRYLLYKYSVSLFSS